MSEPAFLKQILPEGFFQRIKNIVISPEAEFQAIAEEEMDAVFLWKKYVLILAAIGPIATFIGINLMGFSVLGVYMRMGFFSVLTIAITTYALALLSVFIMSLIINALAPSFDAKPNPGNALKLAVFYAVPGWLAGILTIIPALGMLAIVGSVYSLYLLFVGLPILMDVPQEKTTGYGWACIGLAVAVFLVLGLLAASSRMIL